MASDSRRVVVFGGTSYVGASIVASLADAGWEPIVVTRRPATAEILWEHASRPATVSLGELRQLSSCHAVINCAYPRAAPVNRLYRENRRFMDLVVETARAVRSERLIHLSTMAVFGYDLRRPQQAARVRWHASDGYIETKILAENLLLRHARRSSWDLSIVRLGNVLGPGSPIWTAAIAQRLLERKPLGFSGSTGLVNGVSASTVASYVVELAERSERLADTFGRFHHLTDTVDLTWSEAVARFAETLGVEAVYAVPSAATARSVRSRVANHARHAARGGLGGYARALLGLGASIGFLQRNVTALRSEFPVDEDPPAAPVDLGLLRILACDRSFEPHTLADWRPPDSLEERMKAMLSWLVNAGYAELAI